MPDIRTFFGGQGIGANAGASGIAKIELTKSVSCYLHHTPIRSMPPKRGFATLDYFSDLSKQRPTSFVIGP